MHKDEAASSKTVSCRKLSSLRHAFQADLNGVKESKDVDSSKSNIWVKKAQLEELLLELRNFSKEERPIAGKLINEIKEEFEALCNQAAAGLHEIHLKERLECEKIDISQPGRRQFLGRKRPLHFDDG